jgi:hypothetical protein
MKKRDIKEYIEDNGNPFTESKIDFLKVLEWVNNSKRPIY